MGLRLPSFSETCPCRDTLAPPLLLLWNNKKLYSDYIISEHMFAICL